VTAFRFRLQTVLAIRRTQREQCQVALAEALAVQQALQLEHAEVERALGDHLVGTRAGAAPGPVDVETLVIVHRYVTGLRDRLAALAERQRALAAETERRREAVVEIDRKLRVLEKLRDRQHERFQTQLARAESRNLDEIAGRGARTDRRL
jgi:flagellar export protein FliJ